MRKPLTKPWSEGDIAELQQLYARQLPLWRIAARLRRPQKSVRGKLQELRCVVGRSEPTEAVATEAPTMPPDDQDTP